jgi:hypothetical protein
MTSACGAQTPRRQAATCQNRDLTPTLVLCRAHSRCIRQPRITPIPTIAHPRHRNLLRPLYNRYGLQPDTQLDISLRPTSWLDCDPEGASTMIGTSTFDFLFIRVCIVVLHSLAPLCILYCCVAIAFYGIPVASDQVPRPIELIAVAETLFYLAYLPYRAYLQRKATHPPSLSNAERRELFELCTKNIPDPKSYLQTWFLGTPLDEIRRENLKDFFLWAFFNRGGPPGDDEEELEEYIEATEGLLGQRIEPGRGSAKCLRLTLDRVDMLHRSLIWYWASPRW